jgi:uncharacterized protein (TIGR02271 family)
VEQQRDFERKRKMEDQRHSSEGAEVARHEERLHISRGVSERGALRVRKHVETQHVQDYIPREVEEADMERTGPNPDDSGEIERLPDGSISIPILEEELVVTKRTVVRERLIIRKRTRTEQAPVAAELKREQVEVEADPGLEVNTEALGWESR